VFKQGRLRAVENVRNGKANKASTVKDEKSQTNASNKETE
jgi:hypothetical protein